MKTDLYQTRHRSDCGESGAGGPAMDEAMERRARGGAHHKALAGERHLPIRGSMFWCCGARRSPKGYSAPIWMTFRQALELNAHVRKGERGSTVVYASTVTRSGTDKETGEDTQETIPFLKSYTVFNVASLKDNGSCHRA